MKSKLPFCLDFDRAAGGIPVHFYYQVNYRYGPEPWNKNGSPDARAAHRVARDLRDGFRQKYRDLGPVP